ncbi:MAG: DUF4412 domain-containing protein [Acidobacteria bacterium]|nr:DUF4412 domain-containing protein [Acidobacteriota bacterium]
MRSVMRWKGCQAIFLAVLLCVAARAQAGTVIQQEQRDVGSDKPGQQVTLYVDAGKLRIEGQDPQGGKYLMIFDESKQVVWMVDLAKKSYMEMTAAQVQGMGQQMQQAMQQMQEQLAQMPPEQRAMAEQMMKRSMGGAMGGGAPPVTVREKSRGEKVGDFDCTVYEVLTQGQVSQVIWAAPAGQVQLNEADLKTFQALGEFYEPLRRQFPQGGMGVSAMRGVEGFPVRTVSYEGQRAVSEWTLVNIEQQSLDAGLFALPSGLQKTQMPNMQR